MEIKVSSTIEEFERLRTAWTAIVEKMTDATPFQTWEMNYYWLQAHPEGELFLIKAQESQVVFGIAPLMIKESSIQFIGDVHFDYGQFISAERKREIAELFYNKIKEVAKEKKLEIRLTNIPIQSDAFALCRENTGRFTHFVWREQEDTANIKLDEYDGFEGYLKAISASLRRKAIKPCLKETLVYEIEQYSDELWRDIESIYQNRQEDRIGVSTLDWAKDIVRCMNNEGMLKISTLRYDEKRVAYLLFFEYNNCDYVWLTAFMKMEKLQLGHYIRYCLIHSAFERGIRKIDMMRGAYSYKKQWDCNVSVNYDFIVFTNGWNRLTYITWKNIRSKIKAVVYGNEKIYKWYKEKWSKRK